MLTYYLFHLEEKKLLKSVINNTLNHWQNFEENLNQTVKKISYKITQENKLTNINIEYIDLEIEKMNWSRINKGAIGIENFKLEIALPLTISFLSNAKMHIIESLIKRYITNQDDQDNQSNNRLKAYSIIEKYILSIEYINTFKDEKERKINEEWESINISELEEDSFVKDRIKSLNITKEIVSMTLIRFENDRNTKTKNTQINGSSFELLTTFRNAIQGSSKQNLIDVERILEHDEIITSPTEHNNYEQNKRGPGRPKIKESININNHKIDEFFKKLN